MAKNIDIELNAILDYVLDYELEHKSDRTKLKTAESILMWLKEYENVENFEFDSKPESCFESNEFHPTNFSSVRNVVSWMRKEPYDHESDESIDVDVTEISDYEPSIPYTHSTQISPVGHKCITTYWQRNRKPIKLHTCSQCQAQFLMKKDLTSHMKKHAAKTFKCSLCTKVFRHKSSLKKHEERKHFDQQNIEVIVKYAELPDDDLVIAKKIRSSNASMKSGKGKPAQYLKMQ